MTDATDLTAWAQGLLDTFPSIQTPLMQGDNLAILLCQFFDDGEPNPDSDTGWSERAEAGYAEVCAGIKSHFAPVVDALIASEAARKLAEERLASAAVEAEEATRLLVFLLELFAPKLTEAEVYQLRRAKDFAECAAMICKEITE